MPICGHATIAANYARAIENNFDITMIYHKTGAGILPVNIIKENDDYKIVMTQGKIEFGSIIDGANKEKLLDALNIKHNDLLENYEIQIVSTGYSKVMIVIKSIETLNALQPNYDALSKLSKAIYWRYSGCHFNVHIYKSLCKKTSTIFICILVFICFNSRSDTIFSYPKFASSANQ